MSNNVAWKMGVEAKCKQESATVEIPIEEYRALIESKVKLEVITRYFEDGKYFTLSDFNAITGFEIQKKEEEKKKDVNVV